MDDPSTILADVDPEPRRDGPAHAARPSSGAASIRNAIEWAVVIVGALVVAVVVKTFLVQAFYIPSGSMEPTLQIGDRVLVRKVGYDLGDVRRGDIVVFARPDDWQAGPSDIEDLIKRVIALPGERVEVRDGQVYVNDQLLDEPWGEQGPTPPFHGECATGCTIPAGEIFVLGDNRNNSSASNEYGPLEFDNVVGRAFVRVWPLGDLGGL